jgi:hypothetical protein
MVSTPTAFAVAAVVVLGSLWLPPAVGDEAQVGPGDSPLCKRIPEEWTPFTYKGMEFYLIPVPAGAQPAVSAGGTLRCSEIPKKWTPFTYEGQKFFMIPLQPGSLTAVR